MNNRGMLSRRVEDGSNNTEIVIQLMIEKFNASKYAHSFLDNLIYLNDEVWLVVSSTSDEGVDIYNGLAYDKRKLIRELDRLNAGILIFKQSPDAQLRIYLIDDIFLLKQYCNFKFFINWGDVEIMKRFSELGVVLDSKLIGICVDEGKQFNVSHYQPIANVKNLFSI
jgi:hypothetical protein